MRIEDIIIGLLITFVCYVIYDNWGVWFNKEDKEKQVIEYERTEVPLTLANLESLIVLLKNIKQNIGSVKEINILINKKAEVRPIVLGSSDDNYVSYDCLSVWKEVQLKHIEYDFILLQELYLCMKDHINHILGGVSGVTIAKDIEDIKYFIEDQKRTLTK